MYNHVARVTYFCWVTTISDGHFRELSSNFSWDFSSCIHLLSNTLISRKLFYASRRELECSVSFITIAEGNAERVGTRARTLMFFVHDRREVPHARTLIREYMCHRCLSLIENAHANATVFENTTNARDTARFPYRDFAFSRRCPENLTGNLFNLRGNKTFTITYGITASHDYCDKSRLIEITHTCSASLERIVKRRFPSWCNCLFFLSIYFLVFCPLFFFFFFNS